MRIILIAFSFFIFLIQHPKCNLSEFTICFGCEVSKKYSMEKENRTSSNDCFYVPNNVTFSFVKSLNGRTLSYQSFHVFFHQLLFSIIGCCCVGNIWVDFSFSIVAFLITGLNCHRHTIVVWSVLRN